MKYTSNKGNFIISIDDYYKIYDINNKEYILIIKLFDDGYELIKYKINNIELSDMVATTTTRDLFLFYGIEPTIVNYKEYLSDFYPEGKSVTFKDGKIPMKNYLTGDLIDWSCFIKTAPSLLDEPLSNF